MLKYPRMHMRAFTPPHGKSALECGEEGESLRGDTSTSRASGRGAGFTCTALVGLTCLLAIPIPFVNAASLQQEAVSYRAHGYEAQQRGDKAGALAFYRKAAALDPSYPAPYNYVGVLLEEQGRFDEAERSYLQALTLNPSYAEAHANLAMLYERMGHKEKAIVHWLKRYELGDPHDPWTARAEERLVALGILKTYPGMKGKIYTRRRVSSEQFQGKDTSLEEVHAITKEHGDWP